MRLTYDMILADPDLLNRVVADAKRERGLEMNRLVFAPIAKLFHRPKPDAKRSAALTVACG